MKIGTSTRVGRCQADTASVRHEELEDQCKRNTMNLNFGLPRWNEIWLSDVAAYRLLSASGPPGLQSSAG